MFSLIPRSFVSFCIVGAISASIDIALLYVLVEFIQMPLLLAASIALIVASINGYVLNKLYTFKDVSQGVLKQYMIYLAVSLIGLILTLLFLKFLVEMLNIYYIYAKIITVVIVTAWNFTINKLVVFRSQTY